MTETIPTSLTDPINAKILAISEDRIAGFSPNPIAQIAKETDLDPNTIIERISAMLRAGVIRRVRQTLLATNLAQGALVAWVTPPEKLNSAFDWMFQQDPFSGHVVIRSTDSAVAGSKYRLWTTLKVPQGFSMEKHCQHLCSKTGTEQFKLMPAKRLFVLGVGHVRRVVVEGGLSRGDAQRSDAAFELGDALLQDGGGRIGDACVAEPFDLEIEERRAMLRAVERVRRRLVDGHRHGLGGGVGVIARMNCDRLSAHVSTDPPALSKDFFHFAHDLMDMRLCRPEASDTGPNSG